MLDEHSQSLSGFEAGPATWRGTESLAPCSGGMSVSVPVRYAAQPAAKTAFAIEASLRLVDGNGKARVVERKLQLDTSSAQLTLAWDGIVSSQAGYAAARAGAVKATLDLTLVSLELSGGVSSRTVLDTFRATSTVTARAADPRCVAWVARIADLGAGTGDRIVINGRETTLFPRASWKGGRLTRVVGNLASTGRADLDTVKSFVRANPGLYGDLGSVAQLELARSAADPSGVTRLMMEQHTGAGLRAASGRVNALFDGTRGLVAINGAILDSLASAPAVFTYSEQAALTVVRQDLTGRGYDPAERTLLVRERLLWGESPATYQTAYRIDVGPGPSGQANPAGPYTADPADHDTFAYVVSAASGAILDRWSLTSLQWVNGSVNDIELPDPAYLDPLTAPASASTAPPPTTITSRTVRLDVTPPGGQYFLHDHYAPNHVVSWTGAGHVGPGFGCPDNTVCWAPMHWPTPDLFPFATPVLVNGFHLTLMRGFQQVEDLWDRRLSPWLGTATTMPISLWSSTSPPGGPTIGGTPLGGYVAFDPSVPGSHGSLWLAPVNLLASDERSASAGVPAHEVFHHFDETTVSLRRESGHMPTAIKEGMAEFVGKGLFGAYPIDNLHHRTMSAPVSALACLFTANVWTCIDDLNDRFRVTAVGFYPYHRPTAAGRLVIDPWPDCRVESLTDCHVVRLPGAGGTFEWPGTGSSHAGEYELIAQTMLDAWESSTSAVAAGSNGAIGRTYGQEVFPRLVLGAFVTLPDRATFVDLWFAMTLQSWLDVSTTTLLPASVAAVPEHEIEDAFGRHGIDLDLWMYCNDAATRANCQ